MSGFTGFLIGMLFCYMVLVPGGVNAKTNHHWAECEGKPTVFRTVDDAIPGSRVLKGRPCQQVHD
jgi:hypothetical protein